MNRGGLKYAPSLLLLCTVLVRDSDRFVKKSSKACRNDKIILIVKLTFETYLISLRFFRVRNLLKSRRFEASPRRLDSVCTKYGVESVQNFLAIMALVMSYFSSRCLSTNSLYEFYYMTRKETCMKK